MSILSSIFKPFVSAYNSAKESVQEEATDKATFKTALSTATGLDGVLNAVTAEKKNRKEKMERRDLENKILSL